MDEAENVDANEQENAVTQSTTSQFDNQFSFGEGPFDDIKQMSHESVAPQNSYDIRPSFQDIFKEVPVKEIISSVQMSTLSGKSYDSDNAKKWTIRMANEIAEKLRDLEMKRYRHIVQVLLGERKGQGIKSGVRCIWDSEIDSCCKEIFMNDTIFCVVTVFAVFLY